MENVKCLYYAYPSSVIANKMGYSKDGCWYLYVGDEDCAEVCEWIVCAHPTRENVLAHADRYNYPWGNYSMHEERFNHG